MFFLCIHTIDSSLADRLGLGAQLVLVRILTICVHMTWTIMCIILILQDVFLAIFLIFMHRSIVAEHL
jgi:hypothetical protein